MRFKTISDVRRAFQLAKSAPEKRDLLGFLDEDADEIAPREVGCFRARLLRDLGFEADAVAAFRAAGAGSTGDDGAGLPNWAPAEFAQILMDTGHAGEAIEVMRRATAEPRFDSARLRVRLARALMKHDPAAPDLNEIAEAAILAEPKDQLLVADWFDHLRAQGSRDTALKRFEDLQLRSPTMLRSVLLAIGRERGEVFVRNRFRAMIDATAEGDIFQACRRVWTAHVAGTTIDDADAQAVLDDATSATDLFFTFMMDRPKQLALLSSRAGNTEALAAALPALEPFREFVAHFQSVDDPIWAAVLAASEMPAGPARDRCESAEQQCAWLDRVVREGTLRMLDPIGGEIVEAIDSFIVYGRSVYTFRGAELFMMIAGGPWSPAAGLYFPGRNLAVTFGANATGFLDLHLPNVLSVQLRRLARHRPQPDLAPVPGQPRKIVLSVGATQNFAHQVWNFLSSIERLVRIGAIDRLDKVQFNGTEFFGPILGLYPELARIGVEAPAKNNVIDPCPFDPAGLVIPTGGYFVPGSLIERIRRTMQALPKGARGGVEPADLGDLSGRVVVWLGMRLKDKSWSGQEQGTIELIDRLLARFPDALFLLDGFSFPVGRDQITAQWADVVRDISAMTARIRAAVTRPDRVVDMVGNTMRESVLWAAETDVYLAPYGSTQHKVGWFTRAPGIVYSPPNFTPEVAAMSPACSAVETAAPPEFVFPESAGPGERRGLNRAREKFENVNLDVEHIAERLEQMMAEAADRKARR